MILGYVDSSDRLYDVGFATLKMRMRVDSEGGSTSVRFSKASGEGEVAYRVLADKGAVPDYVAGHSLGEYSALVAADALERETRTRTLDLHGPVTEPRVGRLCAESAVV